MFLFKKKKIKSESFALLNITKDSKTFDEIYYIQNDLSSKFDLKRILVSSVNNDDLSVSFALGMAIVYGINGKKTLVVDLDLYSEHFKDVLAMNNLIKEPNNKDLVKINDNVDVLLTDIYDYPTEEISNGLINKLLDKQNNKYDHMLFVVPNRISHPEIALLSKEIACNLIAVQKNITERKLIYNEISYYNENNMQKPTFVILK